MGLPFKLTSSSPPNLNPSQAARTPCTPGSPLTPKYTSISGAGNNAVGAEGGAGKMGLELFLASEASAVVEHTRE